MTGLILVWRANSLLKKKYNSSLNYNFEEDEKKLTTFLKRFNSIYQDNFDLKPSILQLFSAAFWINFLITILIALTNLIYTSLFFYNFLDCQIPDINVNWYWLGTLIINLLFVLFIVRIFSDYYKLSLKSNYRNGYLKLLFLDILTLNFLSVIGTLIFAKFKNKMEKINNDYEITQNPLTSTLLKDYFKTVFKIEMFGLLKNLTIFSIALILGYFIENNYLKLICFAFILWNMVFLYVWSAPRITGLIISWKMFKNLLNNKSHYFLLTTIHFFSFFLGHYYAAVLINLVGFNEIFKEPFIQNF